MSARDLLILAVAERGGFTIEIARQFVEDYAHELAERQRAVDFDWYGDDADAAQRARDHLADLIDPRIPDPARTGEEPEDDGGHDFQWGDDHVERCTRCTLPYLRWVAGRRPQCTA